MPADLERLLRRAGRSLPRPTGDVTREAHRRARAAVGRGPGRLRARGRLALVAAIPVALAAGVGIGALVVPGGTAADEPAGVGFLPEPGWSVYTGSRAAEGRAGYAIAANVPLEPSDLASGRPTPLPYATLQSLPPGGIVLVADITLARELLPLAGVSPPFPERRLPLRLSDADPADAFVTQVRPERPLGQLVLRASVRGYSVDLRAYFGSAAPAPALVAAAQRQLGRLVVDPVEPGRQSAAALPAPAGAAAPASASAPIRASRLFDRTFRCTFPLFYGGVPKLELTAAAGLRRAGRFERIAAASISARRESPLGRRANDGYAHVGGVSAAWPPAPQLPSGGVAVSLERCSATGARPALTPRRLDGGPADVFGDEQECLPPRRLLLRVRVTFHRPTAVRVERGRDRERSLAAEARVTRAQWVLHTLAGDPVAYADVVDSGRARLFTSPALCAPSSG